MDGGILESVLEGVPLPARRDEIVEYAEIEGAGENRLRALEDREYVSFDELADALDAV